MTIEIFFHSTSTPKKVENVDAIYTKGALLCVQRHNRDIQAYPFCNIFSVCYKHQPHTGSSRKDGKPRPRDKG
jgi:hypothetical protein